MKNGQKTNIPERVYFEAEFLANSAAMAVIADDGEVMDTNDAMGCLLEMSRQEIVGCSAVDLGMLSKLDILELGTQGYVIEKGMRLANRKADGGEGRFSARMFVIDEGRYILWSNQKLDEHGWMKNALRVSEQKFAAAFHHNPDAIIITSAVDGRIVDINEALTRVSGYSREELIGRSQEDVPLWASSVERAYYLEQIFTKGHIFEAEAGFLVKSGEQRIGLGSASLIEVDGKPCILGIIHDITERRQVENKLALANERLQALSGRLLQVQEDERRMLSRELHDEIGQSLTAQKIALSRLVNAMESTKLRTQINDVVEMTDTLLRQIRQISLDLRPPQLDDLGLAAAIRWNLERQGRLVGLVTDLKVEGEVADLPEAIAIACYRISQEALTNAIRHASARHVWIELLADDSIVSLEVVDDGKGFDSELLMKGSGSMGIVGMQERAGLANGTLSISAQPGKGCRVKAVFLLGQSV